MSELDVVSTDNRDRNTTVLHLSDGSTVQIDPTHLFLNALANTGMLEPLFDVLDGAFVHGHGSIRTAEQREIVAELWDDIVARIG